MHETNHVPGGSRDPFVDGIIYAPIWRADHMSVRICQGVDDLQRTIAGATILQDVLNIVIALRLNTFDRLSDGRLPVVDGGEDADLQKRNPGLWRLARDALLDHCIIFGNGNQQSIDASKRGLPVVTEMRQFRSRDMLAFKKHMRALLRDGRDAIAKL